MFHFLCIFVIVDYLNHIHVISIYRWKPMTYLPIIYMYIRFDLTERKKEIHTSTIFSLLVVFIHKGRHLFIKKVIYTPYCIKMPLIALELRIGPQ